MTAYWIGNAETGDKKLEWSKQTVANDDRIRIVTSPVSQGTKAYRVEVRPGDNPSGARATLASGPTSQKGWASPKLIRNGEEAFYGLSVFLPSATFATLDKWRLVIQFKAHDTGSPPISINLRGVNWMLNYRPTASSSVLHKWKAPFRKDAWEKFTMHIGWSTDPKVGFIELYLNSKLVVPKFNTSTIHIKNGVVVPNFVAIGLYRDAGIKVTDVIYHDGFVAGRSYDEVQQ